MTELVDRDLHVDLSRLVAEHAWRNDHCAERLHELYVPEGRIAMPGADLPDRAAIEVWGKARAGVTRITRHVCQNMRFERLDAETVRGTTLVSVYITEPPLPGEPTPAAIGEFDDELVVLAGEWRFRSHVYTLLFART
jgi:hypothetical protein